MVHSKSARQLRPDPRQYIPVICGGRSSDFGFENLRREEACKPNSIKGLEPNSLIYRQLLATAFFPTTYSPFYSISNFPKVQLKPHRLDAKWTLRLPHRISFSGQLERSLQFAAGGFGEDGRHSQTL